MELIQKIIDTLGLPAVIAAVSFALEMAMRLLKTDKPKSILLAAKFFIEKIPPIVQKIVDLLSALLMFIDRILPANKLNDPK